jgi:hypothetical protein
MVERTDMSDTVQLAAFNDGRGIELIICLTASDRCFSRCSFVWRSKKVLEILCFVDRASLYNLVNKANLVNNLFLVCLFLVYLSIPTCFWRLCAYQQEKQLCLCDTCSLLFCVDDALVCRMDSTLRTRESSTQNNKYQVSHKHSCFSWWWAHSHPKHVEIDKYIKNIHTKNKLYIKLVLFTRY